MLPRIVFALLLILSLPAPAAGSVEPARAPAQEMAAAEYVEPIALPAGTGAPGLTGVEGASGGGGGPRVAAPGGMAGRTAVPIRRPIALTGRPARECDRCTPLCERLPYHATAPPIGR